ncbi:MAG: hypothetical protein V3V62_06905 [bacterium]
MAQKIRSARANRTAKRLPLADGALNGRTAEGRTASKGPKPVGRRPAGKKTQKQLEIERIRRWIKRNLPPQGTPEWEALCTGCGKCCYDKVWRGSRLMLLTSACGFLDMGTNRCKCYSDRFEKEPLCMPVDAEIIQMGGLPADCPYVENLPGYRPPIEVNKTIDEI